MGWLFFSADGSAKKKFTRLARVSEIMSVTGLYGTFTNSIPAAFANISPQRPVVEDTLPNVYFPAFASATNSATDGKGNSGLVVIIKGVLIVPLSGAKSLGR